MLRKAQLILYILSKFYVMIGVCNYLFSIVINMGLQLSIFYVIDRGLQLFIFNVIDGSSRLFIFYVIDRGSQLSIVLVW